MTTLFQLSLLSPWYYCFIGHIYQPSFACADQKCDYSLLCGDCKIKIIQPIYITMNSFKPVLFGLRAHTIILSMSTHIYVYWIIQAFILAVRIVKCVTHIYSAINFHARKSRTKNERKLHCMFYELVRTIQYNWSERRRKAHKTNELKICNEYTLSNAHTHTQFVWVYEIFVRYCDVTKLAGVWDDGVGLGCLKWLLWF